MKNLVGKINKIPLWVAFLLYQVLISVRIFIEMGSTSPAIFIMQLFWFDCVLMFFVTGFKYILKLKNGELAVLFLGGFLTYIPMIYALLMQHSWHLNFINPTSFKQVAMNMLTLLAVHEYNWPMFPELVLLILGSFALGFLLSGKMLKSLMVAFLSTYSSFFSLGFSWFSVNPEHPSFSHFTSGFSDHVAYSLFYISFFLILTFIAFFKEIVDSIRQNGKITSVLLFVSCVASLVLTWLFLFLQNEFFALDYALVFVPAVSLPFLIIIIKIYLPISKKVV